ncbi:MAG TPA: glycine cleavage system protein H [Bacteroidetes bacterium]|nr:glycine cleavage system protein H [Bacteroidota bacterium]
MVFVLVLLTFAALVVYDVIRHARLAETAEIAAPPARAGVEKIYPPVQREKELTAKKGIYYHPGHTWAKLVGERAVEVGLDDFAQKFVGPIEEIRLPRVGTKVRQGQPIFTIKKGNRELKLVAPISGRIAEINPQIEMDPELVNESPYDTGWLVRIEPKSLQENLRNLLDDFLAQRWMQAVKQAVLAKYGQQFAPAMQDGGELYPGFGMTLSDEQWREIAEEYFMNY